MNDIETLGEYHVIINFHSSSLKCCSYRSFMNLDRSHNDLGIEPPKKAVFS